MDILLLRGFNNYFNRIVKKYTTLADYKSNSASFLEFSGINFNPNDGVVTELYLGSPSQQESSAPLAWDQLGTPDYLICSETVEGTTTIKFRWFVLESERTRDGQYRLALKRDVLAEYYGEIMDAPCYIEKGYIQDKTNTLLLNPENSAVNEIKKDEILLKDQTKCAWLVGYMKKELGKQDVTGILSQDLQNEDVAEDLEFFDCITFINSDTSVEKQPIKTAVVTPSSTRFLFTQRYPSGWVIPNGVSPYEFNLANPNTPFASLGTIGGLPWNNIKTSALYNSHGSWWMSDIFSDTTSDMNNVYNNVSGVKEEGNAVMTALNASTIASNNLFSTAANLLQYNGKYISYHNKVYQLSIQKQPNTSEYLGYFNFNQATIGPLLANFFARFAANISYLSEHQTGDPDTRVTLLYVTNAYSITAVETQLPGSLSVEIPVYSARNCINDDLFDMFAIPYNPDPTTTIYLDSGVPLDSDVSLLMANQIMTKLSIGSAGAGGYDLQLLPYCPMNIVTSGNNILDYKSLDTKAYAEIKDANDNVKSVVLFPTQSNFTKDITCAQKITKTTAISSSDFEAIPEVPAGTTRLKLRTWYTLPDLS